MKTKLWLLLLGMLIVAELVSTGVVMWTTSRQRAILKRHLDGRSLDSLQDLERDEVLDAVAIEFNQTIWRKFELVVIAYHLPALASWGLVTGASTAPPLYYYGATVVFWLGVLFAGIKLISKLSS